MPIGAVLAAGVPYAVYFLGGLTMVRPSLLFIYFSISFPLTFALLVHLIQADPYAQAVAFYGLSAFLV